MPCHEGDRDRSRLLPLAAVDRWDKIGDDDIDADGRTNSVRISSARSHSPIGITKLDLNVPALRIAERVQTAPECIRQWVAEVKRTPARQSAAIFAGCCARAASGQRRCAAEQRDEIAPFQADRIASAAPSREWQHSGLARIKSGACRSAGFRSGLCHLRVKSCCYRTAKAMAGSPQSADIRVGAVG